MLSNNSGNTIKKKIYKKKHKYIKKFIKKYGKNLRLAPNLKIIYQIPTNPKYPEKFRRRPRKIKK